MFFVSNSRFSAFLRYIDKFSMPFQFNIENNNKSKKTEFGGVITFIVYSLSMAYLIYLLNIYFNHQDPKISTSLLTSTENNNYSFKDDMLGFGFFIYQHENNQTKSLIDKEKETGKKYLTFKAQHHYFDENGVYKVEELKKKPCQISNNLNGFYCFDFSKYEGQQIKIKYNFQSTGFIFEGLSVFVERCENQSDCAGNEEINEVMYSLYNLIKVAIKTSRYNTFTNKYDSYYIVDGYGFDTSVGESRQYSLVQSQTALTSGVLFQSKSQKTNFDSFYQTTEVKSTEYMKKQEKSSLKTIVSFRLSQEIKYIQIQYPQITEILAQSMSAFGILLIIGKLGYLLSELKLYQGISNIYLQVYYKRTATTILNYCKEKDKLEQNKNQIAKNQKLKNQSQLQKNPFSQNIQFIQTQTNELNNQKVECQEILQNYKNINATYFPNIFGKIFRMNLFQKLCVFLKKKVPTSALKKNPEQFEQINSIIENTKKMNNIYDFFREFIQIKMIVRLLLTKEQYAAIQFCGIDLQNVDDLVKKKLKNVHPLSNQDHQQPQNIQKKEDEQIKKNSGLNLEQVHLNSNFDKSSQTLPFGISSFQKIQQSSVPFDENVQDRKSTLIFKQEQDIIEEKIVIDYQQITNDPKSQEKPSDIILQIQDTKIQVNEQINSQNQFINHLEILESIDKDETYLRIYLDKFINQIQNNNIEQNELDKRIYQCIAKNHLSEKQ